ncbi:nucleotidyltransferase domain-containing protein [bacterium]|jgi:predicted nucleotidyltransferase|nr:nucleotidyltransferase domain-containing protein [bacterium]
MDKKTALKISCEYLRRVRESNLNFSEAWLFGSYAKGNQHENSDIDIAIVLSDNENHTFETDVKLMVIRKGDETLIEPHAFSKNEFNVNIPIVNQILQHGERLKI